jgi:hypothetical protein
MIICSDVNRNWPPWKGPPVRLPVEPKQGRQKAMPTLIPEAREKAGRNVSYIWKALCFPFLLALSRMLAPHLAVFSKPFKQIKSG